MLGAVHLHWKATTLTITVYSRPPELCRACWATERRLNARKVSYTKVLVDEDDSAKEFVATMGYTQAPVVVVTDERGAVVDHWSGFSEKKIESLLKQAVA